MHFPVINYLVLHGLRSCNLFHESMALMVKEHFSNYYSCKTFYEDGLSQKKISYESEKFQQNLSQNLKYRRKHVIQCFTKNFIYNTLSIKFQNNIFLKKSLNESFHNDIKLLAFSQDNNLLNRIRIWSHLRFA